VTEPLALAYADPPYLGMGKLYADRHPQSHVWDDPEEHRRLIERLCADYDGWALSLSATTLQTLLPMCPPTVRVASWVKPFAAFKRNVRIAYTWEPVLFVPGRDSSAAGAPVGRDHLAESITMRKGFPGAKPERFCSWVLDLLGWTPDDALEDLFPGTGVMDRVVAARRGVPTADQLALSGEW
jgi:hypothetical protein